MRLSDRGASDPVLATLKLVADPWDLAWAFNQVGGVSLAWSE